MAGSAAPAHAATSLRQGALRDGLQGGEPVKRQIAKMDPFDRHSAQGHCARAARTYRDPIGESAFRTCSAASSPVR